MDDADKPPLRYFDRHAGRADRPVDAPASERQGTPFLNRSDTIAMFWPIWLCVIALIVGTPIAGIIAHNPTISARYALGVTVYGGLGAAWLTVPWAAAYLVARLASLLVSAQIVLFMGLAGIIVSLLLAVTGVLQWESLFIALPSLGATVSAAVRMRAER